MGPYVDPARRPGSTKLSRPISPRSVWWLLVLCREERGRVWEHNPFAGHTGSNTDVFPPLNQKHDIFLPKPHSTRVFEWSGGLTTKEG